MRINSMNTLFRFLNKEESSRFVYRGQNESSMRLKSSLERVVELNPIFHRRSGIIEEYTIKTFRKNAHLHDVNFKQYIGKSDLDILIYAQHHGAPTRLLDLTTSKFIALFFAFDNLSMDSKDKYVRLWIIDRKKIENQEGYDSTSNKDVPIKDKDLTKIWNTYFVESNAKLYIVIPEINNKRSYIQDGLFLCVGDVDAPIHKIFTGYYSDAIDYVDINKSLYKASSAESVGRVS